MRASLPALGRKFDDDKTRDMLCRDRSSVCWKLGVICYIQGVWDAFLKGGTYTGALAAAAAQQVRSAPCAARLPFLSPAPCSRSERAAAPPASRWPVLAHHARVIHHLYR